MYCISAALEMNSLISFVCTRLFLTSGTQNSLQVYVALLIYNVCTNVRRTLNVNNIAKIVCFQFFIISVFPILNK